jgi:hypothetical protein
LKPSIFPDIFQNIIGFRDFQIEWANLEVEGLAEDWSFKPPASGNWKVKPVGR